MKDFRKVSSGGGEGGGPINISTVASGLDVLGYRTYTNLNKVPTAIGGVKKDTTFDKLPYKEVLDMLLYPFQNPSFTSFTVDGLSSASYEIGEVIPAGNKTFVWTIDNASNLKANSINLNNETGLANTGSKVQAVPELSKTAVGTHVFTIKAKNTNDVEFSRTVTYSWLAKRYWGVSSSEELTDVELLTFSQELATNKNKSLKYDCTGGKYFYFAYPSSFGDANNITVESMAWNGFVLVKRSVVNINGVSIPMNIYRSMELLNGQVNVAWA